MTWYDNKYKSYRNGLIVASIGWFSIFGILFGVIPFYYSSKSICVPISGLLLSYGYGIIYLVTHILSYARKIGVGQNQLYFISKSDKESFNASEIDWKKTEKTGRLFFISRRRYTVVPAILDEITRRFKPRV